MAEWERDRLISASELERWSYCPLSWKLERDDPARESRDLREGIRKHSEIGREASSVLRSQGRAEESHSITWVYLTFSIVLLLMGFSLVFLTRVGSVDIGLWRIGVVVLSLLLLTISLTIYFYRSRSTPGSRGLRWKAMVPDLDGANFEKRSTPVLLYIFGLFLLVNGIVLLRPLGMDHTIISGIMTFSLMLLYMFLLTSVTLSFRRERSLDRGTDIPLGAPLMLGLVVSLSVLFIFLSDRIDKDGLLGWIFLSLALIWFISALFYDWMLGLRRSRKGAKRSRLDDAGGLQVATLALMASVFTASTFLAKGDNLQEYYWMSIATAGLWLMGAVFFFWRGSTHKRTAALSKSKLNIPEDSRMVDADDLGKKRGKPLVSKKHYLVGVPDMIIEERGFKIPVEVKTGRVPKSPHFSHIMQLGAYLVLMDASYAQSTPYGYIEYAPTRDSCRSFKIEWDMMTKALVLSKVSEVREAERTGVIHRNHNREGKCRNCSRRDGCPERLA
ncbi:MAG: Dna2/Cas4 domain-containing protein [Thermoplasmatota archaeon]